METAARQGNLPTLEYLLWDKLQSQVCQDVPIQVLCVMKRHALLVLVEHAAGAALDWKQVFRTLEQTLKALSLEFTNQVRLHLRIAGKKKSYAFHAFQLEQRAPHEVSPVSRTETATSEVPGTGKVQQASAIVAPPTPPSAPSTPSSSVMASQLQPIAAPVRLKAEDTVETREPEVTDVSFRVLRKARSTARRLSPATIGVGMGVAVLLAGLYAVTRPCVVGECTAIQSADMLQQQSVQAMATATVGQDLTQAHQQINQATRLLRAIPPWSSRYSEAQALLPTYQKYADNLDRLQIAGKIAFQAALRSQHPPHSVLRWQEVEQLWQAAIAQLADMPSDSLLYTLAQNKKAEYETNLVVIRQRLAAERQAQSQLADARSAARLAETRQSIAQSLESWQLVHATWRVVSNRLQEIPPYTTAHREARELLAVYQPRLARTETRKVQEALSAKAYNAAIVAAQKAQSAEQQNLWFQAVTNWRDAVNAINQVPSNTFFYNQSQPLVSSYNSALKQAEEKLQIAVTQQRTFKDLRRVCAGPPTICSYSITDTHLKLKLTPVYEQTIFAMQTRTVGDQVSYVSTINHAHALRSALQAISNNAGKPLEIYSSDDILIDVFNPQ
jgi:hypothetical protein